MISDVSVRFSLIIFDVYLLRARIEDSIDCRLHPQGYLTATVSTAKDK